MRVEAKTVLIFKTIFSSKHRSLIDSNHQALKNKTLESHYQFQRKSKVSIK